MTSEESIKRIFGAENDKFPVGMRVLIVDGDLASLKHFKNLLRECEYEVTTTKSSKVALQMLREDPKCFDIIITEVHMHDTDGFKLLEFASLGMNLPVIMTSENNNTDLVMKSVVNGACDFLVKPVPLEELKNIWQHVIRKNMKEAKQQKKPDRKRKDKGKQQQQQQRKKYGGNDLERTSSSQFQEISDFEYDHSSFGGQIPSFGLNKYDGLNELQTNTINKGEQEINMVIDEDYGVDNYTISDFNYTF